VAQITDLLAGDSFCVIPAGSTTLGASVSNMGATTLGYIEAPTSGAEKEEWDALGAAAPTVGSDCAPGALAHINHAHDIDQTSIDVEHAKFGKRLDELSAENDDVAGLRNDETHDSVEHRTCRQQELIDCNTKRVCDTQLHALWTTWHGYEQTLSEKHILFRDHFCELNGTSASVRTTSTGYMTQWVSAESLISGAKQLYETKRTICVGAYTTLNTQTETCETRQGELQSSSWCYNDEVVTTRSTFTAEWAALLEQYGWHTEVKTIANDVSECAATFQIDTACQCSLDGATVAAAVCPPAPSGTVETVKIAEHDRIQEWVTLKVVQCLLVAVGEQNGVPCDSSTTNQVTTDCNQLRGDESIAHLLINYPRPPPTPLDCYLREVKPFDVFDAVGHIYTDFETKFEICVPVTPKVPCTTEYYAQEFQNIGIDSVNPITNLGAWPVAPFSSSNPACNPEPSCKPQTSCTR